MTATNQGTGLVYKTVTNGAGNFALQQLPVGKYDVTVEAAGFRKLVRKDIELNVAQTLSFEAKLEVGEVEQAVEVTAVVGLLQTASSDLGTTIQRNKLMDLPLFVGGNVRNLEQFIFLAPGVTGDTGNTQISGSPSRAKEVLIDGVASTGIESGGVIPGNARPRSKPSANSKWSARTLTPSTAVRAAASRSSPPAAAATSSMAPSSTIFETISSTPAASFSARGR